MNARHPTVSATWLKGALAAAGKLTETMADASGASLLVLPYGGRLIGAFAPGGGENFLWTNPYLAEPRKARELFESVMWANSGGERTWIAPEADFFYPNYPLTDVYFQPRTFDPGSYAASRDGNSIFLENHLTLRSFRTGEDIALAMKKSFTLIPLERDSDLAAKGIAWVAYRVRLELELLSEARETPVGLWSLIQLPPGGTMIAATRRAARPVPYFGHVLDEELEIRASAFRWDTRNTVDRKIGIIPAELTGRLGYTHHGADSSCLVVRDIVVDTKAAYVDAPFPATKGSAGPACAVQFCSVDHAVLGSFRELEYHSPAIGGETGLRHIRSESLVRCFRGSRERIEELEGTLFG
jgi:hypothetical protein